MNIYKLSIDDYETLDFGDREGFVIIAPDEKTAREHARDCDCENEVWLDEAEVTAYQLGPADPVIAPRFGCYGIVLEARMGLE